MKMLVQMLHNESSVLSNCVNLAILSNYIN